ncbi:oxidoreductase [Skermania piniformis]
MTGANSGLGEVATAALAAAGGTVVMACRDEKKATEVAQRIGDRVLVRHLDLADLGSVREFAASMGPIDVLINNAGVMAVPFRQTADGFEMQIGTNHLGHFALTGLLIDRISDRVVTLSSDAHNWGSVDLDDLNWERRSYNRWRAYGASKVANLLFTYELQRKLTAAGSSVISVAAHPGYAATGLQSNTESILDRVMWLGNKLIAQSAEMGALPELYAATAVGVTGGSYYGPDGIRQMRGYPKRVGSNAESRDQELAAALWARSEELTGVRYPV